MTKRRIEAITWEKFKDFIKLYKVFGYAPYHEIWTSKDIRERFRDLLIDGHVCGYYLDDICVGLVTFRPMHMEDKHPIYYECPEKVAYLADLAVLPEYRKQGIGTELMKYALDIVKQEGFETIYMKTLETDKSMIHGIAVNLGFKRIDDVITIETIKGTMKQENKKHVKIYLEKSFEL